jgi:hypothetical protein
MVSPTQNVKPTPAAPFPPSLEQGRVVTWKILCKSEREYAARPALVGEIADNLGGCHAPAVVVARKMPAFSQRFFHGPPADWRWISDLTTKWVVQQYVMKADKALLNLTRIERSDCAARVLWALLTEGAGSWSYREIFAVRPDVDAGFILIDSDCVATATCGPHS